MLEATLFLIGAVAFIAGARLKRAQLLAARSAHPRPAGEPLGVDRLASDYMAFLPSSLAGGGALLILASIVMLFFRAF